MRDKKPNPKRDRARELARQLAAMSDAERAEFASRAPVATIDGRILSPKNMALAAMQMPAAAIVGGFRQWIGAGRCVRKGEAAIYIWIPSLRAVAPDPAGETGETETRFFLAPVFDVSQTAELAGEAEESAPMAEAA